MRGALRHAQLSRCTLPSWADMARGRTGDISQVGVAVRSAHRSVPRKSSGPAPSRTHLPLPIRSSPNRFGRGVWQLLASARGGEGTWPGYILRGPHMFHPPQPRDAASEAHPCRLSRTAALASAPQPALSRVPTGSDAPRRHGVASRRGRRRRHLVGRAPRNRPAMPVATSAHLGLRRGPGARGKG